MRQQTPFTTSRVVTAILMVAFCASYFSCTETETTDSTRFALFYAGVTDIGPSMNFNLDGPTYIGGAPSSFAITQVKRDGEAHETNCFAIDENKGSIAIANTNELPVGRYTLSVSCLSNGKLYEFKDIVSVNMMKPVPDGIVVEPNRLEVEYGDIIDENSAVELPTAQVTTDGNHISIQKYLIANVRREGKRIENNNLFTISPTGKISIERNAAGAQPGKYTLDLKLTTAIVDEDAEEGIFADALEIDVASKPLALVYRPEMARIEVGAAFVSEAPEFIGSTDRLAYRIKSTTPANAPISIDPATGVIALSADNNLQIDDECKVSVSVGNLYGTTDFEEVFAIRIVAYINPIENFSYNDTEEIIQATGFEHPVAVMDGDEETYAFVDLPPALSDLMIDSYTGRIYANKGNSIPIGLHTVTVLAKNSKSEKQASFKLKVVENPYYFTYVHWGNNLSLSPARSYASQHRVNSSDALLSLSIPVTESDLPEGVDVVWEMETESFSGGSSRVDDNGTLTFTKGWVAAKCFVVVVSATTGKGTPGEITVKTPVFVDCSAAVNGITVSYTPFVLQVNPRKGGSSAAPSVTGVADLGQFLMDYRRTFNYYNINGPSSHVNGQPSLKESFMYSIWAAYYAAIGSSSVNTGARAPMSYYDNVARTSTPAGYVNNSNLSVVVNPEKWKDEAGYANGVMIGQMTYATDGKPASVAGGAQIFPLAIWLDTNF